VVGVVKEIMEFKVPKAIFDLLKGYNFPTKNSTLRVCTWLLSVLNELYNFLRMLLEYKLPPVVYCEI
jgi:hypothetical protein